MAGRQDTYGKPLRFDPSLGNCAKRGVDPDLFFPEGGGPSSIRERTMQAKALCSTCPMVEACLMSALENKEWGIWGGSTMKERVALSRSRNKRKSISIHLNTLMEGKYRVSGEDENEIKFT